MVFYFIGATAGAIWGALDVLQSGPEPARGAAALLDLVPLALSGLIALLALRVYQHKSRGASTLLFAIFVIWLLFSYVEYGLGSASSVAFQMLNGFVFFQGMKGTYLWHSTYRHTPQAPEGESKDRGDASNSATQQEGEPDEQAPSARGVDDLCPKCLEYSEPDAVTCRYCGADLLLRPRSTRS